MIASMLDSLKRIAEDGGMNSGNLIINFSAKTNSQVTQGTIEGALERKSRTSLGPPRGQKAMVVFVDDVNMPGRCCIRHQSDHIADPREDCGG